MVQKYILVQSPSALKFAEKKFAKDISNIKWLTTSPYMHNYFERNGYNFENLENLSNKAEFDQISKIIVKKFFDFNELSFFDNKDFYDFFYFKNTIMDLSESIFYRYFLINNLVNKYSEKIIFIGCATYEKSIVKILRNPVSSLYYDRRFCDLFSKIAKRSFPNISVVHFTEDLNILNKKKTQVYNNQMQLYEKILSLLNNCLSSFFFKIVMKLHQIKIIKNFKIFFLKKKRQIVVNSNYTDHIEESFLKLILSGNEIAFLPNLKKFTFTKPSLKKNEIQKKKINTYKNKILNIIKNEFSKYYPSYEDAIEDLLEFHYFLSREYSTNAKSLNSFFSNIVKKFDKNHIFLTNVPYSKMDLLYCMFLKRKKIKTIISEHGITFGLSSSINLRSFFYPILLADIGLYYWKYSLKPLKLFLNKQKTFILGFPKKITTKSFYLLKKFFIKKLIKINKNSICYVADIEKNNFVIGPYFENDLNYYKSTRSIISYLCNQFSDKTVCLKLYPTNRYVTNYDFDDMKKIYPNLKIIRFIDFRFLREVFDQVYISGAQSALGWLLGSRSKIFYIQKENHSNCYLKGEKIKHPKINYVRYIMRLKNIKNSNINNKWFLK